MIAAGDDSRRPIPEAGTVTSVTDRTADDAALIEQYLAGDIDAFDALMRAHEDRVFSICLRMLRDREGALDATQETFVTVFRKADRFAGRSAFGTWLYRVAVNTCYDVARRTRRQRADPLPVGFDPADPTSGDDYESAEVRPEIEEALSSLPAEFRAALILADLEGLALETVSEALGIPIGTVKSRLFRGRRLLADSLGNLRGGSKSQSDETNA